MSQDDSILRENMRLRTELSALETRRVEAVRDAAIHAATNARLEAEWDALLNSSVWRMAQRLFRLAGHVPPRVRRGVRFGARGLKRGRDAVTAPATTPPHPAGDPAIPGNALYFGLFTQDMAELAANPCHDAAAPLVSVIILNWNRSEMTLACVRYVLRHTRHYRFEIIIADNGSSPDELDLLQRSGTPARVLSLGRNLYFGEANNIAAEQALGQYLFFLNNDAFVHDGWLEPLVDAIERLPHAGAVGSRLLYPDGTLQEAGGLVSPDGMANQLGKHASGDDERYVSLRQVDYASAAALLVRRQDFLDVLGFDLCYEPAYYEDADLCMKLRARGQSVFYCPNSVVTHVENATSLDRRHDLRLENIIQVNRITFVSRWSAFLLGQPLHLAEPPSYHPATPGPRTGRPRVALHTPFMLTPGGGERYLLSIAQALAGVADVMLVTAWPCSAVRLRRIGMDLQIDVSRLALRTLAEVQGTEFDLAFVMGNAVLPPIAGLGRHNVYICQFPFPMLEPAPPIGHRQDYDELVVYSDFVRRHLAARNAALDLPVLPVRVVAPPVRLLRVGTGRKRRMILSVGRFFAGHHCKRQDLMVAAFRTLVADGLECELHLAGSLRAEPEHRDYYLAVVAAAQGLPVVIHPNIDAAGLDQLYAEASVYWHLTGLGSDPAIEPELSEHFGIAVVEAMSAGCVPVAFDSGGPAEIIASGRDGFLVDGLEPLVERTRTLLADPALAARMGQAAAASAQRYDEAAFAIAINALAASLLPLPMPSLPVP